MRWSLYLSAGARQKLPHVAAAMEMTLQNLIRIAKLGEIKVGIDGLDDEKSLLFTCENYPHEATEAAERAMDEMNTGGRFYYFGT